MEKAQQSIAPIEASTYTLCSYPSNINTNYGFSSLIDDFHIVIPITQRDYAQGRRNNNVRQVRNSFLDTIFSRLVSGTRLDMDFVYGVQKYESSAQPAEFYPLDGQQRLTTLFLIHWYLAIKYGHFDEFKTEFYDSKFKMSKFRYETRKSSSKFCEDFVCNDLTKEINSLGDTDTISILLHNQCWYKSSWKYDPTTEGILNMLDTIHEKFAQYKPATVSEDIYARQLYNNLSCLTFQVLFIDSTTFNLGDDLYIKMNSRGKPLTDFETFKAKYCQLIKNLRFGWASEESIFSRKLDHDWIDCFWTNFRQQNHYNVDQQLMSFMKLIIASEYASKADSLDTLDILFGTDRAKKNGSDLRMTFYRYHELGILENVDCSYDYAITRSVIKQFDILVNLCDKNVCKNFEPAISNTVLGNYPLNKDWKAIQVDSNGYSLLTFSERLYLYAYFTYLAEATYNGKPIADEICNGTPFAIEMLNRWTRFMRNLIESHSFENLQEAANAFRFFRLILKNLKRNKYDITKMLATSSLPELPKIAGYNEQIEEEIVKARIVYFGSLNWAAAISTMEDDKYLNGRIGFLLIMSGLHSVNFGSCSQGIGFANEQQLFNKFKGYSSKVNSLLSVLQSISRTISNVSTHSFLLERAMLTKRLYGRVLGYSYGGCTMSLSNFYSDNNSWRAMAAYTPSYTLCIDALKDVLDDNAFCNANTNVISSLQAIINNYINGTKKHWWTLLIEDNNLLKECNDSCLWINDRNTNSPILFILSKYRLSSYHSELYTKSIYNSLPPINSLKVEYLYSTTNPQDVIPGIIVRFRKKGYTEHSYMLYMISRSQGQLEMSIRTDELAHVTDTNEISSLTSIYPGTNPNLVECITESDVYNMLVSFANKITNTNQSLYVFK